MLFSRVDFVAFPKIHWTMLRLGASLWIKFWAVKVKLSFLVEFFSLFSLFCVAWIRCAHCYSCVFSRTDSFPRIPEVGVQRGEHSVLVGLRGIQEDQNGAWDDLLRKQDLLWVCTDRSTQTSKLKQKNFFFLFCLLDAEDLLMSVKTTQLCPAFFQNMTGICDRALLQAFSLIPDQHRLHYQRKHYKEHLPADPDCLWYGAEARLQSDGQGLLPTLPKIWHLSGTPEESRIEVTVFKLTASQSELLLSSGLLWRSDSVWKTRHAAQILGVAHVVSLNLCDAVVRCTSRKSFFF